MGKPSSTNTSLTDTSPTDTSEVPLGVSSKGEASTVCKARSPVQGPLPGSGNAAFGEPQDRAHRINCSDIYAFFAETYFAKTQTEARCASCQRMLDQWSPSAQDRIPHRIPLNSERLPHLPAPPGQAKDLLERVFFEAGTSGNAVQKICKHLLPWSH